MTDSYNRGFSLYQARSAVPLASARGASARSAASHASAEGTDPNVTANISASAVAAAARQAREQVDRRDCPGWMGRVADRLRSTAAERTGTSRSRNAHAFQSASGREQTRSTRRGGTRDVSRAGDRTADSRRAAASHMAGGRSVGSNIARGRTYAHAGGRVRPNLMKYAGDGGAVQALYAFTTGHARRVFVALVTMAVLVGLYGPVRDLYAAHRTEAIVTEQLAIYKKYEEYLQKDVNTYLSKTGIEDVAREKYNMVKKGEKTITVTGGSSESSSNTSGTSATASGTPTTKAKVQKAQKAVYENSPWYLKALDLVFAYNGPVGQTTSSSKSAS